MADANEQEVITDIKAYIDELEGLVMDVMPIARDGRESRKHARIFDLL